MRVMRLPSIVPSRQPERSGGRHGCNPESSRLRVCASCCAIAAVAPDALAAPAGCHGQGPPSCHLPGHQPAADDQRHAVRAGDGRPGLRVHARAPPTRKARHSAFSIVNRPPWATFSAIDGPPERHARRRRRQGEHVDIVIAGQRRHVDRGARAILHRREPGQSRRRRSRARRRRAAREGQAYEFRPAAADADGDPLTFTIANRPAWASFDAATGLLRGTPGAGTVGSYRDITIRVSDGELVRRLPAFSIAVEQVSMGSATLSWAAADAAGRRIAAARNLAGYRIRYGTAPGSYPQQLPDPESRHHVLRDREPARRHLLLRRDRLRLGRPRERAFGRRFQDDQLNSAPFPSKWRDDLASRFFGWRR